MHCPGSVLALAIVGLDVSFLLLNGNSSRIDQIKEETTKGEVLLSLGSVIIQGWPNTRLDYPVHFMHS